MQYTVFAEVGVLSPHVLPLTPHKNLLSLHGHHGGDVLRGKGHVYFGIGKGFF